MKYKDKGVELYNQDCLEGIKNIPDGSIDVILTDPPYLYLKNQKLEREFDEMDLFTEWKRVLKKGGFIVLFGRGTSFYRWNSLIACYALDKKTKEEGFLIKLQNGLYFFNGEIVEENNYKYVFEFKEEVIWDKRHTSSPVLPIGRVHETISIHTNGAGKINKVKVPYEESKGYDISTMIDDINRIKTAFNNSSHFDKIENYLKTMRRDDYREERFASKHDVTFSTKRLGNRVLNPVQAIVEGMNEKSIIRMQRPHYISIHPTEKPVGLLERLLQLVSVSGDTVLDCFSGSGSTAEACINTQRKFIGFEIDEEYYNGSVERLNKHEPQLEMF